MDLQKQTYLNTERLEELYERKERVSQSYGADAVYGGMYFRLKRKGKVLLRTLFKSITGCGTLYLDGALFALQAKYCSEREVILEKGEHLFEAHFPDTHGGYVLSAEGASVEAGRSYLWGMGGCRDATSYTFYMQRADSKVQQYAYNGTDLTVTPTNYQFYDEAYLYDKTNAAYTDTKRNLYVETTNKLYILDGRTLIVNMTDLGGVAFCDGRTLPSGTDYLVGYVDNGELIFAKFADRARLTSSSYSSPISGMRRIFSAARGSVFLVENRDHLWSGYYFHDEGAKTLTFSQSTLKYDEIPLCRNSRIPPTADVDDTDGTPIFYYKREDGKLMSLAFGSTPTVHSYADAFYPTGTGGLLQIESELHPYTA